VEEGNQVTRPIALAALTVLELPPPQIVSTAAQAGYDGVGLRLIPATPQEVRHPLEVEKIRSRIQDTGVRVLDVEIFRLTPQVRIPEFERVMAVAAELKATQLLVAGNDPDESRLARSLAAFCDLAARYGLAAIAQLCDAPAGRPADMQEIIRQARADRLFPGEGALDLKGLLGALPDDLPISLEIPVAMTMPPPERARRALAAARALL